MFLLRVVAAKASRKRRAACSSSDGGLVPISDEAQVDGFGPLLTLGDADSDALPVRQTHDAGTLQRRGVHEDRVETGRSRLSVR